jgi:hypothetical protein
MEQSVIIIDSKNCMYTNKKVTNKILLLFEVTSNSDIEVHVPKTITHPDTDPNNKKTETFCSHSKTIALQSNERLYKCTFIDVGGISSIRLKEEIEPLIELDAIPIKLSNTYPKAFILRKSLEYKYSSDKTSSAAAHTAAAVVSAAVTAAVKNATTVKPVVVASETSSAAAHAAAAVVSAAVTAAVKNATAVNPLVLASETSSTETSSTETSYDKSVDEFVKEFSNSLIGSTKAVNELLRITGTSNSIPYQNTVQRTGNIIKAIIKAIEAIIENPFVITFKCTHIEHHIAEQVIYFRNDLLKDYKYIENVSDFNIKFNGKSFNKNDMKEKIDIDGIKETYKITNITRATPTMYTNVYIDKTFGNNNITTGNIASTSVVNRDGTELFSFGGDIKNVTSLFDSITDDIMVPSQDITATKGYGRRKYRYIIKHKITSKKKTYKKHTHKIKSKKRKTYKKHKHNKSAKSKKLHR